MQDVQGWWASLVFSGLSISIGMLIVLILRDRRRRREEREQRLRRLFDEYRLDHEDDHGGNDDA